MRRCPTIPGLCAPGAREGSCSGGVSSPVSAPTRGPSRGSSEMAMSPKSDPDRSTAVRLPLWRRVIRGVGSISRDVSPPWEPGPPPGFDWRWYVKSYADLAAAGVTDEKSAIRHWRKHGRREGRRFAPRRPNTFDWLTYVDHFPEGTPTALLAGSGPRPPLACPSVDSIFLRAWGDLVCWDDAGSDHVLQPWDPNADYADVYLNGPYQEIR